MRTHWQELVWWYSEELGSFSGPSHYLLVLKGEKFSITCEIKTGHNADCSPGEKCRLQTVRFLTFKLLPAEAY